VVTAGSIRFILEIEESGFSPTKVCGKFLTSALSTHFIHDILGGTATAMHAEVTFVQVMDASKLPLRTKKVEQGAALEHSIQRILPLLGTGIKQYRLFFFHGVQNFMDDHAKRADLEATFTRACS